MLTDSLDINKQFHNFYSELYISDHPIDLGLMHTFFENLEISNVSEDSRETLDDSITLDEIKNAITCMQSVKCPGPDSLPTEFYLKNSLKLSPLLKAVFEDSLDLSILPPTLHQATISLLLKKGKDPFNCSSYRPISLLNVDIKILAKVLASIQYPLLFISVTASRGSFVPGGVESLRSFGVGLPVICSP